MRFAHPEILFFLLLVPAYGLAAWFSRRVSRRRLAALLPAEEQRTTLSTANPTRAVVRAVLLATALILLIFAAARPQFGFDFVEVERRGVDVVLAIDVSASMLARDVAPDRLGQAKIIAARLVDSMGSDRVAVLPFAGDSVLRWPLSFDHGAAKMLIEAADVMSAGRPGTGLKTAVEGALKLFGPEDAYEKVLVIFSDGEDHLGGLEKAAQQAEKEKMIIHTIGIGDPHGVPIPNPEGDKDTFKRDRSGAIIYTRLEPEPLQVLSAITHGLFVQAGYSGDEVKKIAHAIRAMKGRDLKSSRVARYRERYQWFLIPAVALLAIEGGLSRRKRRLP
jgi:Ca-activated chloride channel family protein